jgi:hypothetical protein
MAQYSKKARRFLKRHIERHIRDYGMTPKQAVAAAYAEARHKGYKLGQRRDRRGRFR